MAPNSNDEPKLDAATAAASDPTAKGAANGRYDRFISRVSSLRQPSIIRDLLKILATASDDMIPLSGGLPNPAMFPFEKIEVTLKGQKDKLEIAGPDLNAALQYLPTQGHGGLLAKLRELQCHVSCPWAC